VVPSAELLPRAMTLARTIASKSPSVTATIKTLQHVGQQYDVEGALRYELGFAANAYAAMAADAAATRERLSKGLSARHASKL